MAVNLIWLPVVCEKACYSDVYDEIMSINSSAVYKARSISSTATPHFTLELQIILRT